MKKKVVKPRNSSVKKKIFLDFLILGVIIIIFSFAIYYSNPGLTGAAIYENQPGIADGNDTYIRNSSTLNFGSDTVLKLGVTAAGSEYRGLLQFNVSTIDSQDTLTSALVQTYISTLNTENITINAYRITSSWNESDSTWYKRNSTTNWISEGADYNELLLDSVIINESGKWYNFSILNAARGWVNGSYVNYGIILIPQSGTGNNNLTEIISSDYISDSSLRPKITIDHTSNAAPTIASISINSNLTNLKKVGEDVSFTIEWTDLESDNAQFFVCNSSSITTAGCEGSLFCNTSISSSSLQSCSYTILSSNNRTTNVWISACDAGNCSTPNATSFNMNHLPTVLVVAPNGGEIVNQSQGNYSIQFNETDSDSDKLFGAIYYGETQNSTTTLINGNLNFTQFCTDTDSDTSTTNNCTYSWNTTGLYGNYFLTIIANDSYHPSNDSSITNFSIVSLVDTTAPNITAQWIESGTIYSGKSVSIYANISESHISTVWFSINTTPQQNVTMSNTSRENYNGTFIASSPRTYQFKVYANDTTGNTNNSLTGQDFNVAKPTASPQGMLSPSTSAIYNTIKVTSQLNATDPLRDVYAYLYVSDGFTFLTDYSQNTNSGNYTSNQTKTTTWFVSTPSAEANYSLNVSFTDHYGNQWNSSNTYINVMQTADSRLLTLSGYPEVETSGGYFIEGFFTKGGVPENADSASIKIYDSIGSLIVGPVAMNNPSTGTYNYSYTVGASVNEGQWKTVVTATKSLVNYTANEFWKVVGGPFDVRDITIDNAAVNALQISAIVENTGGAVKDIAMAWNLTREDTGVALDSGADTFAVNPGSTRTYTITPSTTYVGQARITFLGTFSGTEKAGAYKTFSTTSSTTTPSGGTPTGGGGSSGGGGGGATVTTTEKATSASLNYEKEITLTKNIPKKVEVEVENTGTEKLTNITLTIQGLPEGEYNISPMLINSLSAGKKGVFEIEFTITDFIGEKQFKYLLKTNELEKEEDATLLILSIQDFFKSEIERLKTKIKELKGETDNEKIISEIKKCEDMLSEAEKSVEKEEFINAKDSLDKSKECIDVVEKKLERGTGIFKFPEINMPNITIIIAIVSIIVIIALLYYLYMIYKKLSVLAFFKREEISQKPTSISDLKKENFDSKLKNIEKKLGVEKYKTEVKSSEETDKKYQEAKSKENPEESSEKK
ncbi:hypothetical protein COU56_02590 [Candidatus Pacearchaeota archaeon CG10_big_fil_rev_8_21_14_0_10_31_9]|nr:MAG: hypothetical protein COU56_02590 [Candidatus Pacearchaeota archaeon CG10_big_fil_rev_8_21_14_0_10_31_9]